MHTDIYISDGVLYCEIYGFWITAPSEILKDYNLQRTYKIELSSYEMWRTSRLVLFGNYTLSKELDQIHNWENVDNTVEYDYILNLINDYVM